MINVTNPEWIALALGALLGALVCFLFFGIALVCAKRKMHSLEVELAQTKLLLGIKEEGHLKSTMEITALKGESERLREKLVLAEKNTSELSIRLEEQRRALNNEKLNFEQAKAGFSGEFEQLAHKVFLSQQKSHIADSKSTWQEMVAPYKEQLNTLVGRVAEMQKLESDQRSQLMGQIAALQKQSQSIGQEAVNLTNALKGNNKAQGIWGEFILERVLEQSGLLRGREYEIQENIAQAGAPRLIPDVVIHLPKERRVVVDSKVSLVAYEKLVSQAEAGAQAALVDSVRAHMKSLSSKSYWSALGADSLDFVVMFVPIESAFVAIAQSAPDLLTEAYSKRVVLVSPSSLMAVIKTIEGVWARERQDSNVQKIVDGAGKLHDQFVLFTESLVDVGSYLSKAVESHDMAVKRLASGRGNLIRRVGELKKLGAKANKTIPRELEAFNADSLDGQEIVEEES